MSDAPRSPYRKEFAAALPRSPYPQPPRHDGRQTQQNAPAKRIMDQQQYADYYTNQEKQQNAKGAALAGQIPAALDTITDMTPYGKMRTFLANRAADLATGDSGETITASVGDDIKNLLTKPQSHWDERNQFYQNAYQNAAGQFPDPNSKIPPALPPAGQPMNPGRYMQREALHPFNWMDVVPNPGLAEFRYS